MTIAINESQSTDAAAAEFTGKMVQSTIKELTALADENTELWNKALDQFTAALSDLRRG